MRVFSKKKRSIFYSGQKASHKKTTGLPTFRFSMISPSYRKLCLGALERYLFEQNSKNKKKQQQPFKIKVWFR
jgi:hypothetical protein